MSAFASSLLPSVGCPPRLDAVFWIYILQSADGALYVGQTNDVEERLRKHRLGLGSKHTHDHPGVRLVFVERHPSLVAATAGESQLKRWSRAKKEALIAGDLDRLRQLSRRHQRAERQQPLARGSARTLLQQHK